MTKQKTTDIQGIDKPHYQYWQALYLSLFSSQIYVDVAKRWKRFSLGYLLLLFAIISIPLAVRMTVDFNQFFNEKVLLPVQKLPVFSLQNGLVSLDKPMPYFVKNDAGDVISIIDTTGKITGIDNTYPQLSVLITKDTLYYRSPPSAYFIPDSAKPINVHPFDKQMNQIFNGSEWINSSGIKNVNLLFEMAIYPSLVLLFFSMALVLLLCLAIVAQLVATLFFKLSLSYFQAFRLLMVSSTLQILVLFFFITANLMFPWVGLLLVTLLAVYYGFALISLKRSSFMMVNA